MTAPGAPLRLRLGNQTLDAWGGTVRELRVVRKLSLPSACELGLVGDGPLPVTIGDGLLVEEWSGLPLFDGEVTALSVEYLPGGLREVRVRAYDRLHRLRKSMPAQTLDGQGLRDVAQALSDRLGVRLDLDREALPRVWTAQLRQSDLELLTGLSVQNGRHFQLQGDCLEFLGPAGNGTRVVLELGRNLLEARIESNVDAACPEVEVYGWNALQVTAVQGRATAPSMPTPMATAKSEVLGAGVRKLVGVPVDSDEEAQWAAQAELDWRSGASHTCWGVCDGDGRLRPGSGVRLDGLDAHLNGEFVLTEVVHRVEAGSGYVTEFCSRPNPPRGPSAPLAATLGVVAAVDDPADLGRVQVRMPAQAGLLSGWLQVLSVAAGAERGLMALPDVGDQVLVLLPHGEGSPGILLGGLYGQAGLPDSGVVDGRARRLTLRSAAGQKVVLDAAARTLVLEDGQGSVVELTPEHVRVHAARRLVLEAPGQEVVIRGERINFERA
ncbi:type IV secretion protein Rhs (plasmid) [Deinococcus sp. AJ005]|nr:type IV secretion protein Rhs [Deinococcus sp. AJ005]